MIRIFMPPLEFQNINEIPVKIKVKRLSKTKGELRIEKKKASQLLFDRNEH